MVARQGDPHGGRQDFEPKTTAERELFFLRETAASAFEYAEDILQAFDQASNSSQPNDFYLLQNCPNPFNPTTTIEYGLPQNAEIEISVYNALGRKVDTVLKGRQAAGVHRAIWPANGHANGQYYLHMRGRGISLKRKMQLVK